MKSAVVFVRSLCFNIALFGVTALMCFLLVWTLVLPRRSFLYIVHLWLRQVAWLERNIVGITYQITGFGNIPQGSCIIAAKHQSAWETFKLHLLFFDPAIVLKKELLHIPVWGWYLRRSGMIPIDRGGALKALSGMTQAARKAVSDKRKIVIFPQGTRVKPGEQKSYKSGVAALYQELHLPVVPMALNSGLLWPKHSFIKKPGVIIIAFLPPIPPGIERHAFMAKLKDELETASDSLAKL